LRTADFSDDVGPASDRVADSLKVA
jgi:hypothetical protein